MSNFPAELDSTRRDLLSLRAELHRQRDTAPTPGIAHALRLADAYLFLALGYCGHNDQLFPEQGHIEANTVAFPNLR
jgi:hypothetical protein